MGRFTSPDPVGIMKQKLLDPQQWNMYEYARNNPLRFIDPTGLYVCNGTKRECKDFESERKKLLKGSDKVRRAAGAFGNLGEKNGVTVNMVKGNDTSLGEVGPEENTRGFTISDGKVQQATVATINTNSDIDESIAHEGTHVADRYDYVQTVDPATGVGDRNRNIMHGESEVDAYTAQNALISDQLRDQRMTDAAAGGSVTLGGHEKKLIDINQKLSNPPYSTDPDEWKPMFPTRPQ
jgi:hypothetical protein